MSTTSKVKSKVIYETEKTNNIKDEICSKIKLLQYLQEGYTIEFFAGGFCAGDGWLEKHKESTDFDTRCTEYRVLEKPKEITVYTLIYQSSNGKISSTCTTDPDYHKQQVLSLNEICGTLLKTHVDKVII